MGWKNIRDHYRIGHIVQVQDGNVLIGSPYVHDIVTIAADGTVAPSSLFSGRRDDVLTRYVDDLRADPEKLRELFAAPDTFTASIPVYTYDGATIIEKQCEALGWPNCTHDGQMMYENTFSADKAQVVRWAKENALAGVAWRTQRVSDIEADLAKARAFLAEYESNVAALDAEYPEVVPAATAPTTEGNNV